LDELVDLLGPETAGELWVSKEMEVDDETYPLDNVTNYDQDIDLKLPEKQVIKKRRKS
jgi:hypothetical protein